MSRYWGLPDLIKIVFPNLICAVPLEFSSIHVMHDKWIIIFDRFVRLHIHLHLKTIKFRFLVFFFARKKG